MPQENLAEQQRSILRRLSSVDLTSNVINRPVVAEALEKHLAALGLSQRPITWAKDGTHAHNLVARSDPEPMEPNLPDKFGPVFHWSAQRAEEIWTDARDSAKAAGYGAQLDLVKSLIRGHSVRLSVPWRLYEGRLTGDRGHRTDPDNSPVWQAATDALEYAARASAECALAMSERLSLPETATLSQQKEMHTSYKGVWLPYVDAFEAGLWLFWITSSAVIALPRPQLQLHGEQLHAVNGPAVSWHEGEEQFFFLNGVHVPREIVETPASELDPRLLLKERNTEVRREIVRKIGIERVCEVLEAECLDRQGNYELLLLNLGDWRTRPFLKMRNPSIGVYHIEGVAPECRTVAQALAWRNQSDVPPSVLT
jgi:hypothetical protein